MDSRLTSFQGQRLSHLHRSDCPQLALAIVGATRKLGVLAERRVYDTTPVVYLHGRGFNIVVRGDDWDLITPYLRDGSFNTEIIPSERPQYLQPGVMLTPATLDSADQDFYSRVLGVLQRLFPEDYPTSDL